MTSYHHTLEPAGVAVRIGDRDLWIGNRAGASQSHLETLTPPPDYVVSVNQRPTNATTDHHPLSDGIVNNQDEFDSAVNAARRRYAQSGRVLVNCAAGISRSATVIATTLALDEDLSFEEAVKTVQDHRPQANPHPRLRVNALRYLAKVDDREDARLALDGLVDELSTSQKSA